MNFKQNKKSPYSFILFICVYSILASCSPTAQSGFGPSSEKPDNSDKQNDGSNPASPPADVSTASQFFVAVDTKTVYPTYTSQIGALGVPSYGTKCAVEKSTTAHQSLSCVVEAPELSLWYGGLQLAVNIPSGMCEYMREIPYWYYNKEIGVGPTAITKEITNTSDATGGVTTTYRCSVDGSGLSATCSGYTEANFIAEGGSLTEKCIYDTTGSLNGKNCCFGGYSLTTITRTVDASGTVTAVTTNDPNKDWGGNITDCIGGQGKTNWDATSFNGYPISRITDVRSGILKPIVVDPPAKTIFGGGSVIPVANYYSVSSTAVAGLHYHTGYGSASGSSSDMPYYVRPVSDRSGTLIPTANPTYEYQCLDDAFEVKHKIKLYVRQWDVYSVFNTYKTTGVYSGVSPWDYTGSEGTNCDGVTDPDEPCNDFTAPDDIPRSLGGSYTGTRSLFFPNDNF
ncbi:MAG: hypothetical protein ACK4VO_07800 [Pseudobdellovibrio sp.]